MAEKHVPYEDAILLDMLLDIAAGDFNPHQREIVDEEHNLGSWEYRI